MSSHKWSKHGIRSKILQLVDDETCCPVCDTECYSCARLVKHLLEKRVRSRTRGVSCRDQFLLSRSKRIPTERVNILDQRDANVAKAARRKGHTSIIADRPCDRRAPSILLKRRPADDAVPCARKNGNARTHNLMRLKCPHSCSIYFYYTPPSSFADSCVALQNNNHIKYAIVWKAPDSSR